jgi:hypothetical protein
MEASRTGMAAVAISWPTSENRLARPIPRVVRLSQAARRVGEAVARSADSPVLGKVHNVQESLAERD